MTLQSGIRLGPYEVVAPLGAGGMGEVYRARDTRLGREVAIKVLPQHLASHTELRTRFEREAKTVSALNHPHICTLFDVGREGQTDYLVMELVDGETLAHRLGKGALPTQEVLRLGGQIADALDRAHRAGVVHRDLKPGNVMLTRTGAKLMDFGLARVGGTSSASDARAATIGASPTFAQPLTAEGALVGTFEYMAPEQLEGREADARSDLWALGCVLYEMASGRRAFIGNSQASLISSILRDTPPPIAQLMPLAPLSLERIVGGLLTKDPEERIQTAHDVKLQLTWLAQAQADEPGANLPRAAVRSDRRLAWGLAALASLVAFAAWWRPMPERQARGAERFRLTIQPPSNVDAAQYTGATAISPDGKSLAFVASDSSGTARIWLRPLAELAARPITGSEGADQPFWSPDGRWLGFVAEGKLKKLPAAGGIAEILADAPDARGASWGSTGEILFAPIATGPIHCVSEDGGEIRVVAQPDSARQETALRFPQFLADGERFLYVSLPRREALYDVHLASLRTSEHRVIMRASAAPIFVAPDYLITAQRTRLVAHRIDLDSGELVGKAITLGEASTGAPHDGMHVATASTNGLLAYWSPQNSNTELVWFDRNGRRLGKVELPAGNWGRAVIAPDGRHAIVTRMTTAAERDLWLADLETGSCTRFTQTPPWLADSATWSPDGRRVAYVGDTAGPADLWLKSVDGGEPELLHHSQVLFKNSYSWTANGDFLAFEQPDPLSGWDVWVLPVQGDRRPQVVARTRANEGGGWFSPDGRWIAYYSDESGRNEIYVQSFPEARGRSLVSGSATSGTVGTGPCWWSRDGRELMFRVGSTIKVASVQLGETLRIGASRKLFDLPSDVGEVHPTPDLQRLLATVSLAASTTPAIVIDLNWMAALTEE